MSERRLTLIIPGLWGPCSPAARPEAVEGLRAPELARWLGRGDWAASAGGSLERMLCACFGIAPQPETDLPVAALTRLADGAAADDAWYLRADPMHLRADRDTVISLGQHGLDLTLCEAQSLAAELGALWAEDGLTLEALTPLRWYLRAPGAFGLRTRAPESVLGRSIFDAMPVGADARVWRRRLNEAQMLLHGSAINARREQRGVPAVNSVWLWGAGRLPARHPVAWAHVWSNEPLGVGLARWAGVEYATAPATAQEWLETSASGRHLIVLHGIAEAAQQMETERWRAFVESCDEYWLRPLAAAVSAGKVQSVELHVGGAAALLAHRKALRRWWRRGRLRAWPHQAT